MVNLFFEETEVYLFDKNKLVSGGTGGCALIEVEVIRCWKTSRAFGSIWYLGEP